MSYMSQHQRNLGRLVQHDAGPTYGKYRYVVSRDDLTDALLESHADLNYALRKEAKRDRFILNAKAMEAEIRRTTDRVIQEASQVITDTVSKDIVSAVYASVGSISGNGARTNVSSKRGTQSRLGTNLGRLLGKAMVETVTKFWKAMYEDD